jgi:hypothetical protein
LLKPSTWSAEQIGGRSADLFAVAMVVVLVICMRALLWISTVVRRPTSRSAATAQKMGTVLASGALMAAGTSSTSPHKGTKAEAKLKLAELVAAVGGNTYVEPSSVTVAQLVAERIALWRATGAISAKTAERREQHLSGPIKMIGPIPVQKLSTVDLERWHAGMLAVNQNGPWWSASGRG